MKLLKEALGNSMYHLAAWPISVPWKGQSLNELSFKEFYEHQKWKVITWFDKSSPRFPLNFGMLDGNLCGITSHQGA